MPRSEGEAARGSETRKYLWAAGWPGSSSTPCKGKTVATRGQQREACPSAFHSILNLPSVIAGRPLASLSQALGTQVTSCPHASCMTGTGWKHQATGLGGGPGTSCGSSWEGALPWCGLVMGGWWGEEFGTAEHRDAPHPVMLRTPAPSASGASSPEKRCPLRLTGVKGTSERELQGIVRFTF